MGWKAAASLRLSRFGPGYIPVDKLFNILPGKAPLLANFDAPDPAVFQHPVNGDAVNLEYILNLSSGEKVIHKVVVSCYINFQLLHNNKLLQPHTVTFVYDICHYLSLLSQTIKGLTEKEREVPSLRLDVLSRQLIGCLDKLIIGIFFYFV